MLVFILAICKLVVKMSGFQLYENFCTVVANEHECLTKHNMWLPFKKKKKKTLVINTTDKLYHNFWLSINLTAPPPTACSSSP